MSTTTRFGPLTIARLRERPAGTITAGLLAVAIGQIVFEAGIEAWSGGGGRGYFGPGSLLGARSTGYGAVIVGALIFLVGFAVVTLGAYRVMSRVEIAARLASGPASRIFPSIPYLAGGLLAVVMGFKLYWAGEQAPILTPGGRLGIAYLLLGKNTFGQIAGTIIGVIGLCLLVVGVYRLLATIQVVVNAAPDSSVSRARTPVRSAVITIAGLLAVAIGQVLARAELDVLDGALRSPNRYFGPASLLSSEFTGQDGFVVGEALSCVLSVVGLALVIAGAYRVTSRIDAAAEVARAATSRRSPSAPCFTGGLLALVVGYELQGYPVALFFYEARFVGIGSNLLRNGYLVQIPGAIAGVIGLCLLLLGTYRLVTNVRAITDASATPIFRR